MRTLCASRIVLKGSTKTNYSASHRTLAWLAEVLKVALVVDQGYEPTLVQQADVQQADESRRL